MFNLKKKWLNSSNSILKNPLKILKISLLLLFLTQAFDVYSQSSYCSLTATHTVPSGQTVNISTWFPTSNSTTNAVIDIEANGILVIDKTFTFKSSKFRCGNNASISTLLNSGCTFGLSDGSILQSCGSTTMWSGIRVNVGTKIEFSNNWIFDANRGIYFPGGFNNLTNILRNTRFINNRIGMQVGDLIGSPSNVGFLFSYGNLFTETAPLKDTNVGLHFAQGIQVNQSVLIFGTPGINPNIFDGILIGLTLRKGSNALIANCHFKNMLAPTTISELSYDNINPPTNEGIGIFVNSSQLTVTKIGTYKCRFTDNPNYDILTVNPLGQVLVEYANFSGLERYGIRAMNTLNPANLIIKDNHFDFDFPISFIHCERPPGFAGLSNSIITGNVLDRPTNELVRQGVGRPMISIVSTTAAVNEFAISDNILNYRSAKSRKHGIYISGTGSNFIVDGNTISFSGDLNHIDFNASDRGNLGITFDKLKGSGNVISNNTIKSAMKNTSGPLPASLPYVNDVSFIKCGIHVSGSDEPFICNNTIDSTFRGIHIADVNSNTVLGENHFNRHVYGLCFANDSGNETVLTAIPSQVRTQNTWLTNASDYVDKGAQYLDFDSDGSTSPGTVPFTFFVDPNQTGHMPPTIHPNQLWFVAEGGTANSCVGTGGRFDSIELKIATGEYPFANAAQEWDLERRLWSKLLHNPGIEDGITEIEDFKGDPVNNPTSPFLFASALYLYENAFYPDSTWQAKWNSSFSKIAKATDDIPELLLLLSLDTITVNTVYADSLTKSYFNIALIQDTLRNLADTLAVIRNKKLDNLLLSILPILPTDEGWERAWVEILTSSITLGKGEEVDTKNNEKILEIANSCYSDVGEARSAVRAYWPLANLEDICQHFDTCFVSEERSVNNIKISNPLVSLFPNPAQNQVRISIDEAEAGGMWEITSPSGIVIESNSFVADQKIFLLDLTSYPPGIYFFTCKLHTGKTFFKSFVVIK